MVVKILRAHINDAIKLQDEINEFIEQLVKEAIKRNEEAGVKIDTGFKQSLRNHIGKRIHIDTHVVPQWTMIFKSNDGDINQSVEDPILIAVIQY